MSCTQSTWLLPAGTLLRREQPSPAEGVHAEDQADEGEVMLDTVEELAVAQGGHAQLMDLCEALADPPRLHAHMQARLPAA